MRPVDLKFKIIYHRAEYNFEFEYIELKLSAFKFDDEIWTTVEKMNEGFTELNQAVISFSVIDGYFSLGNLYPFGTNKDVENKHFSGASIMCSVLMPWVEKCKSRIEL